MVEYNKKVMQHFLKPKNVGKIEKPDGVGKVGNMSCLLPTEKVHSNPNLVAISQLNKNEVVINHEGKKDNVVAVFSRRYNGEIIELKNKLGQIKLTPEHLILSTKLPPGQKFLRNKGKKTLIPSWHHAGELKKGDIAMYPISNNFLDVHFVNLDIPKEKYDFRSKSLPKKIPINGKFLRLAGYFLAEGQINEGPCKNFIQFALHIKEKDIAEDIKKITKELFGLNVIIREKQKENGLVVYIYSAILARFFKKLFNRGAEHKKIPEFMMELPIQKQEELIKGLWRGDGYINLNRNGPRAGYSTISYQLFHQIKILLMRQKIVPSLYQEDEKEIKGVKHKKSYRIHVGQRESLVKLSSMLGYTYNPKSYSSIDSWFDNKYFYTPITSQKTIKHSGEVINLEVNNAHSFISEAFSLHNCGDIMYVYIKIKEINGKEIIDKIKFQTLGCAAAIATSDVVIELAKGKSVQEALKITNKDVVNELGGLPSIKVHCSLLAEEALGEAIYDYLQRNGKLIPKELQERHKKTLISEKNLHDKFKCGDKK